MNRRVLFDAVRPSLFSGRLRQGQVDGMNALLDAWEADYSNHPVEFLAYCLATAKHETADTMRPITERGSKRYFDRYDINHNPRKARELGNLHPGDGYRFRGRGHVQLTGRTNYRRAGRVVDVDLERHPKRALELWISARILFQGCIEGWFTTKTLGDYITPKGVDYRNARRVVNGTDKAATIAGYAKKFEAALRVAYKAPADPKPTPHVPERRSLWQLLADFITFIFKR